MTRAPHHNGAAVVWSVPPGQVNILRRSPEDVVNSVLHWLHRWEQHAIHDHDMRRVAALRVAWALVYSGFYGGPRPFAPTNFDPAAPLPTFPAAGNAWRLAMRARPLRRVIAITERVVVIASTGSSKVEYVEILECGHRLAPRIDFFGETRAKRRRCAPCGEAKREQQPQRAKAATA